MQLAVESAQLVQRNRARLHEYHALVTAVMNRMIAEAIGMRADDALLTEAERVRDAWMHTSQRAEDAVFAPMRALQRKDDAELHVTAEQLQES